MFSDYWLSMIREDFLVVGAEAEKTDEGSGESQGNGIESLKIVYHQSKLYIF